MTSSSKWTVRKKLWLLTAILVFTTGVVGFLGSSGISNLAAQLENMRSIQLPAVRNMTLVDMMHDSLRATAFQAIASMKDLTPETAKQIRSDREELEKNIQEYLHNIQALEVSEKTKAAIVEAEEPLNRYIASSSEVVDAALNKSDERVAKALPEFEKQFSELETRLEVLGELIIADADRASQAAATLATQSRRNSLGALGFGILMGLVFGFLLIRDLQNTLGAVVAGVTDQSEGIVGAAVSFNQVSDRLASASNQQSSALQEAAASVDEIAAMIKKTDQNTKDLETSTLQNLSAAQQGQLALNNMVSSIDAISSSISEILANVESGNKRISEIVQVIGEIRTKTAVINDIVFQTKILSFNASVEAARAGENGKGFSVVAEEIGNLAQMSGRAAKEITEMLVAGMARVDSIVSESQGSINALITDGKEKAKDGTRVVNVCSGALSDIVEHSNQVSSLVKDIAGAIREQSQGIEEISKAVHLLRQVNQENVKASLENQSSATGLTERSESLNKIVIDLQLLIGAAEEMAAAAETIEYVHANGSRKAA